jgi:preprotein translocase subunit YajC
MKVFSSLLPLFAAVSARAVDAAPAGPAPQGGGLVSFAPLLMIGVLFYFLLLRPQQKQAREQKMMIDALKKGDKILTSGGMYGTVVGIKGKVLEVKISDEVKVLIARSAVTQVVQGDPAVEIPEVVAK